MTNIIIEIEYYKSYNPKVLTKQLLNFNKQYKKVNINKCDFEYKPYKYIIKNINGVVLLDNFINNIYIWLYNNNDLLFNTLNFKVKDTEYYFSIKYQINNYLTNINYINLSYNFIFYNKNYKNDNLVVPLIPIINNIECNYKYCYVSKYNFNNIELFKNCMSYIFYNDYKKKLKPQKNNLQVNSNKIKRELKHYINKKVSKNRNKKLNKLNKKIADIEKIIIYIIIFITFYIIYNLFR